MLRTLTLAFSFLCLVASGQEIQKNLKHFSRVVASPRVNVVLEKGNQESIRLVYHGVSEDMINIAITGRTLRLYLDKARKVERMKPESKSHERESMYAGATVTAYITYRQLDALEIRGDQELTCKDEIESEEFTLRAYGENAINLASLRTGFFKAKLYGKNKLYVGRGRTLEQKYLLYGENKIDSKGMRSDYIITSIFGEGSLRINSVEEVRIDAFGEPQIYVAGGAQINRRLVIGKANIYAN
ncbi:MAG: DUF2807 domain-containing protein [Bacteroidota bacterium]|nr:DUF2807 domain-containing protein [Bacteroidota bacterium]